VQIVVVSPSVQRFDATTHYWQAEFAACVSYLRARFPRDQIQSEPAGLIGAPGRIVVRHLLTQPNFLLIWARVWESQAALELGQLCREVSPKTRILVWGDGPLFIPQYFDRNHSTRASSVAMLNWCLPTPSSVSSQGNCPSMECS